MGSQIETDGSLIRLKSQLRSLLYEDLHFTESGFTSTKDLALKYLFEYIGDCDVENLFNQIRGKNV